MQRHKLSRRNFLAASAGVGICGWSGASAQMAPKDQLPSWNGGTAQDIVGRFIATFNEFPPRQRPSSFPIDQVMELLQQPHGGEGVGTRALK